MQRIDTRALSQQIADKLSPCSKGKCLCHVQVVITASGKYRVGCDMHGEWSEAYNTPDEAVKAWNKRQGEQ